MANFCDNRICIVSTERGVGETIYKMLKNLEAAECIQPFAIWMPPRLCAIICLINEQRRRSIMAESSIDRYLRTGSLAQSSWRSIVLFGKNTASYKFALAQSLMQLAQQGCDSVTLDELAIPFAEHICEHAKIAPR